MLWKNIIETGAYNFTVPHTTFSCLVRSWGGKQYLGAIAVFPFLLAVMFLA